LENQFEIKLPLQISLLQKEKDTSDQPSWNFLKLDQKESKLEPNGLLWEQLDTLQKTLVPCALLFNYGNKVTWPFRAGILLEKHDRTFSTEIQCKLQQKIQFGKQTV